MWVVYKCCCPRVPTLEVSKYTQQHSLASWTLLVNVKTCIIKDSWYQPVQWPVSDSHHLWASRTDWGHCSSLPWPQRATGNWEHSLWHWCSEVTNRLLYSAWEKPVSQSFVKIIKIWWLNEGHTQHILSVFLLFLPLWSALCWCHNPVKCVDSDECDRSALCHEKSHNFICHEVNDLW